MRQDTGFGVSDVMPLALATGLFKSLATIQEPDGVLVDAGQPSGNFIDVDGLVDIKAMDAPVSEMTIKADETKSADNIQNFTYRHVLLGGYFPTITLGTRLGWRAVVDGTPYDLLGAESDSQRTQTRMYLKGSGL